MKILLVHNYYGRDGVGGEDCVFESEAELLRRHGHEVISFVRSNKDVLDQGRLFALKALMASKFNRRIYSEVKKLCEKERPDVAHIHNFWFSMSPSVHAACYDAKVPVVQTLHNFRLVCLNAMLVRNDKVCTLCVGNSAWAGLLFRCYHNSWLHSIFVRRMIRQRNLFLRCVDQFIALTGHGLSVFLSAGFPAGQLCVKPHFIDDAVPAEIPHGCSGRALYVGRFSEEKGVTTLMAAWQARPGRRLTLIGDGPLKEAVVAWAGRKDSTEVHVKETMSKASVLQEIGEADFLILPSMCYETFGLVMVESFCAGRPVIASRHGAMAEIVRDGETGLLFEPGNNEDLAEKIEWMLSYPEECRQMGLNARREYEEKYTPDKNYTLLMEIYRTAIARRAESESGKVMPDIRGGKRPPPEYLSAKLSV